MPTERPTPGTPDQPPISRADVYRFIVAGIDAGLPAPKEVRFDADADPIINLDSIADLDWWADRFEFSTDDDLGRNQQPYPIDADPADFEIWTASTWRIWNGRHLRLSAADPVTDEHRRQWVESGRAAERAEYLARQRKAGEPS